MAAGQAQEGGGSLADFLVESVDFQVFSVDRITKVERFTFDFLTVIVLRLNFVGGFGDLLLEGFDLEVQLARFDHCFGPCGFDLLVKLVDVGEESGVIGVTRKRLACSTQALLQRFERQSGFLVALVQVKGRLRVSVLLKSRIFRLELGVLCRKLGASFKGSGFGFGFGFRCSCFGGWGSSPARWRGCS